MPLLDLKMVILQQTIDGIISFLNKNEGAFSVVLAAGSLLLSYALFKAYQQQASILDKQRALSESQNEILRSQNQLTRAINGTRILVHDEYAIDGDEIQFFVSNYGGELAINTSIRTTVRAYADHSASGHLVGTQFSAAFSETGTQAMPPQEERTQFTAEMPIRIAPVSEQRDHPTKGFSTLPVSDALTEFYRRGVYELEITVTLLYEEALRSGNDNEGAKYQEINIITTRNRLKKNITPTDFFYGRFRTSVTYVDSEPHDRELFKRIQVDHRLAEGITPEYPTYEEQNFWG